MAEQYVSNGVTFNNVRAGIYTDQKISRSSYQHDEQGNVIAPQPIINAIDIDWNNAEVPGITGQISSSAQILSILGDINNRIETGPKGDTGTFDVSILEDYATIASVQELIRQINARIDEYHVEYSFTYNLTNITANANNEITMKKNDTVVLNISANTGYILPNSVTVTGAQYSYNQSLGNITITNPTESTIVITASTTSKRQCAFNFPTLANLSLGIIGQQKSSYEIGDTIEAQLTVSGDNELYGLPNVITGTNCTISNYNSSTGTFVITCKGTGNMTITAVVRDVANYKFAVALETNPIFTVSNGIITGMNVANISSLDGSLSAIGQSPVNFTTGFTAPSSVNIEGAYVWMIIPSKYFNGSNYNFINGTNKYLLKQSNIQDLTINTKIKDCVYITTGKIPYTLICVSNNGLGGPQEFKKI